MGLFKRKPDPISDRARTLKSEIARLESQIQQLNSGLTQAKSVPRLRSTAVPHHPAAPANNATPQNRDPFFEEVDQKPLKNPVAPASAPGLYNDMGARKFDLVSLWRRLTGLFRHPAPSNPKLLNLLAAGNIQGLRPLRYEKRVARNRFIALVVVFLLVLWGIFGFFLRHR